MHVAPTLLVLHIILVIAWLGIDVGVFYSSFVMRRPGMSTETRLTVRRIMRSLDLAPRVSLILTVPVAVALAHVTGFGVVDLPDWLVWLIGIGGVVWAGVSVRTFRAAGPAGTGSGGVFPRIDGALRAGVSAVFVVTGIHSLVAGGVWLDTWIALKALLFGTIVACGLWIRMAARSYHPHLAALLEQGESPERLAALNRSIRGVYPPVLTIWSLLVVMVGIAVYRPG